jgi:hypothetical protein
MAWEQEAADFQSRFDKSIAQADQMTERTLRVSVTKGERHTGVRTGVSAS